MMRRTILVAAMSLLLIVLMAGAALAHVCFTPVKQAGAGSAGTATVDIELAVDEAGNVVGFSESFVPGPDLQINFDNGRVIGGFVTLTFNVTVYDGVLGGDVIGTFSETIDALAQNTVGGGAHFAGPGVSGCDGVGMDSLEACLMEALTA